MGGEWDTTEPQNLKSRFREQELKSLFIIFINRPIEQYDSFEEDI